jgi:hypothetical protein
MGIEPLTVKAQFQTQHVSLPEQLVIDLSLLYAGHILAANEVGASGFSLTNEQLLINPNNFDSKSKKALWQALKQHNLLR